MRHDTAGDPITGVKWSRRTTRDELGHDLEVRRVYLGESFRF